MRLNSDNASAKILATMVCMLAVHTGVFAADTVRYLGYSQAIELKNEHTRVILCPEVGGRVLEYSWDGRNVLFLSDAEKKWLPGEPPQASAGRFDIGPEYVVPKRNILWSGKWTAKITGERSARLTSQKDPATGVQLSRDFELDAATSKLICTQTITNVSEELKEWCHWSRTFAVGKGICIIPLTPESTSPQSRFPSHYVMYEGRGLINVQPEDPRIRRVGDSLQIFPTPQHPKLGFDSYVGEIGYAAPNNLFFLKRFPTYPNRVYNEAAALTISVWYPDNEMVELEPIGPRESLKPGQSASFTEEWWLTPFPFPGTEVPINPESVKKLHDSLQ